MKHSRQCLTTFPKYSAARRIFNSLLGVWICGQTLSFVFDIFCQPSKSVRDVLGIPIFHVTFFH